MRARAASNYCFRLRSDTGRLRSSLNRIFIPCPFLKLELVLFIFDFPLSIFATMKLDLKLIGENIRVARAVRSYSQDGLANKLGKSQNWLQRVEKGEVDLSINIIESIAQELDMPSS